MKRLRTCVRGRRGTALTAAVTACCALAAAGCAPSTGGSGPSSSSDLTVSYSESSASELPLLIANDAGYFRKRGLHVKLRKIEAQQGIPAMISHQVQFSSVGGSEVLSAVAAGVDMRYLLTTTPVYAFVMYAKPGHTTADTLRGQRIGITSTSGSNYVATVLALKDLGLTPDDVQMVPLGSVTSVNDALLSGNITAALSHPPASSDFVKHGFKSVVNLVEKRTDAAQDGIAVTKSYLDEHRDVAQKFCDAIGEAIKREKSDKPYAEKEIAEFLDIHDKAALDATYAFYAQGVLPNRPLPAVSQFTASQQTLAQTLPAVGKVDLSSLVYPDLVR